MAPDYKPTPYTYTQAYDPFKYREYNPAPYKPEYQPYKPSHVGIYGEQQHPRKIRTRPKSAPKQNYPRPRKSIRTFESYRNPTGPDIRVENTGPEYQPHEYKPKPYVPSDYKTKGMGPKEVKTRDPLKQKTGYKTDRLGLYKGDVDYKLTEDNNAGMRHWRSDFVDDTVATHGSSERPERKYKPEDHRKRQPESKPKEIKRRTPEPQPRTKTKTPENPQPPKKEKITPFVAPILVPPPPQKKTYKTQPTQTQPVKTSTHGTQFDQTRTKTTSMQTKTPLPFQAVAPLAGSKTLNAPTQSKAIQTSPALEQPGYRSPVKTRPRESPKDMYYERRWTPSPEVVPVVFAANPRNHYNSTPHPIIKDSPKPETPKYESARAPSNHYEQVPRATVVPVVYNARAPSTPKYESTRRSPTPINKTPQRTPSLVMERENSWPRYNSPVMMNSESVNRGPSPKYVSPAVVQRGSLYGTPTPVDDSPIPSETEYRSPTPKHQSPVTQRTTEMAKKPPTPIYQKPTTKSQNAVPFSEERPQFHAFEPATRASPMRKSPDDRSRLPPEIRACIEAYHNAHSDDPQGGSLSTIRRSMGLGGK